jgi:ABC-type polysaccharide/polyol phosphate export permease
MAARAADPDRVVPPPVPRVTSRSRAAVKDVSQGLSLSWMWSRLAVHDIRQRYRGSMLGPFWITISMGVMILALGILYSKLFKVEIAVYLPFLCLGLLFWTYISATVNDACQIYMQAESVIKQTRIPMSVFVFRVVLRNVLVFAHNALIFVIVMLYFSILPTWRIWQVIPAFAVITLWLTCVTVVLSILCVRFRDIGQIIASLLQLTFFMTPIIWTVEQLGERTWAAEINPVFAFIDIIRSPLMGVAPHWSSWPMASATLAISALIASLLFVRFRARIAYWV